MVRITMMRLRSTGDIWVKYVNALWSKLDKWGCLLVIGAKLLLGKPKNWLKKDEDEIRINFSKMHKKQGKEFLDTFQR